MHTLLQDIRYAIRQLFNHPSFSLTAVLSFALGIGATVSVFSVIYAVLLHPYAYKDINRLVTVSVDDLSGDFRVQYLNGLQLREVKSIPLFETAITWDQRTASLTGHDAPENAIICLQNGDTFPTLGVPPLLGRNLGPADSPDGGKAQPVIMLNYKFWMRNFQGDPSVVGRTLELDHQRYTIVGVTRPHMTWGWSADVYMPQEIGNDPKAFFGVILKLKPGVTYAQANAALQPLLDRFAREQPTYFPQKFKLNVQNLSYYTVQAMGGTLYLLFAAVAMLLAIGCGNVSILLLARGTARQHEFAIRAAVGASGGRIVRQLLTESLALSLAGAGLGILLAYGILGFIVARLPQGTFPPATDISINLPVLLFCVGVAILTGILFGLYPALQAAKPEVSQVMQSNTRKMAGNSRSKLIHRGLIAAQIALTMLLLTAAGAAIEGFLRMVRVPLGYNPHNVLFAGIPVHQNTLGTWEARVHYFEALRAKVAELPDVISTSVSLAATPPDSGWSQPFEMLGKPATDEQKVSIQFVDSNYFSTLQVPLQTGRLWDAAEMNRGAMMAVVNQAFLRRYYPAGSVLGQSVKIPALKSNPPNRLTAPGVDDAGGWIQIIGVTHDVINNGLDKPVDPAIYLPYSAFTNTYVQMLVRSRIDPMSLLHDIQKQIATINPDQQIALSQDLEDTIQEQPEWARGRLMSVLFGGFSALALLLSAIGLYSVVSYSVEQRTGEFGIRMALGAGRSDVLRLVLASAGASVGTGIGIGIVLSMGLNKVIARLVTSSGHYLLILPAVAILLLAVAALASFVPARRASEVDPMTALRCD